MHRPILSAALLGAATLAACSKEAPKADSASVAPAGAAATPAASYDPATRTMTAVAKDFAFLAPDSIPAGWTNIRLINDGPALHHMAIVRIDSGKTMADVQAAMQLLKSKTAALGEPRLEGEDTVAGKMVPALYFGPTEMDNNFAIVDEVDSILIDEARTPLIISV